MTDLSELLDRVKAATGPDRLIDADLFFELDPEFPSGAMQMVAAIDPATFATGPYTHVMALPYTSSIDAALALTERVLPDAGYMYQKPRAGWERRPGLHGYASIGFGEPLKAFTADAPTAPLAIIAATLSALIAKEAP